MKMKDTHIASEFAQALEDIPAARADTRPDREPPHEDYKQGIEIGYYAGDNNGGEFGNNVLLPLEVSEKIFDFVENLCRQRLAELGVSDAYVCGTAKTAMKSTTVTIVRSVDFRTKQWRMRHGT